MQAVDFSEILSGFVPTNRCTPCSCEGKCSMSLWVSDCGCMVGFYTVTVGISVFLIGQNTMLY